MTREDHVAAAVAVAEWIGIVGMNDEDRRWWEGPTPEESEKLNRAAADMRAAVAPLLEALAGDLRRLMRWVGGRRVYDARVEDQDQP